MLIISAERYSRRSRGPKATLSLLDSKTVEGNLKDLLQSIDSKLYLKFDAAMRQRIGDKIKVRSFAIYDIVISHYFC